MKRIQVLLLLLIGFLFIVLVGATKSRAQEEPVFILTWRAQSYAPPHFRGKVLPTAGSPVIASVELLENGGLANLSEETIIWQLDRKTFKSGKGIQSVVFTAPDAGGTHELRARINNFRDQSDILIRSTDLPVVKPEAVIESPFSDGSFQTSRVRLRGQPYFFNVERPSDLNFSWEVNGEVPAGTDDPSILDINATNVEKGGELAVKLDIKNPSSVFEAASQAINLIFK